MSIESSHEQYPVGEHLSIVMGSSSFSSSMVARQFSTDINGERRYSGIAPQYASINRNEDFGPMHASIIGGVIETVDEEAGELVIVPIDDLDYDDSVRLAVDMSALERCAHMSVSDPAPGLRLIRSLVHIHGYQPS